MCEGGGHNAVTKPDDCYYNYILSQVLFPQLLLLPNQETNLLAMRMILINPKSLPLSLVVRYHTVSGDLKNC